MTSPLSNLSQSMLAGDIRRDENAKPDDCATTFEIHNHLNVLQQGNWLAGQTRPDLNCQIRRAQQCMPTPTSGQIREAKQRVRRARQFADSHLTFWSIPLRDLRFVAHTDYSSNDQDGSGRTQSMLEIWLRGVLWSGNHVDLGHRSQGSGFGCGTLGMGHVQVRHCSVPSVLFGKQSGSPPVSVIDCKSVFDNAVPSILCHRLSRHP